MCIWGRLMGRKRTPASKSGAWIRKAKRQAIYDRDGRACLYCGADETFSGAELQLDHYVPPFAGGTNESSNLVTACAECNNQKNGKSIREYFAWLREKKGLTVKETREISDRCTRAMKRDLTGYLAVAKYKISQGIED